MLHKIRELRADVPCWRLPAPALSGGNLSRVPGSTVTTDERSLTEASLDDRAGNTRSGVSRHVPETLVYPRPLVGVGLGTRIIPFRRSSARRKRRFAPPANHRCRPYPAIVRRNLVRRLVLADCRVPGMPPKALLPFRNPCFLSKLRGCRRQQHGLAGGFGRGRHVFRDDRVLCYPRLEIISACDWALLSFRP